MPWEDIKTLVKDAAASGDVVAAHIRELKLQTNHITLYLTDPFDEDSGRSDDSNEIDKKLEPALVDIDLALTAFANATRLF